MIWLFLILAVCTVAVVWAGISLYLRVRRNMQAEKEIHELEHKREAGQL
jgi:putative exporter of polyketide antibiotics